MKLLDRFISFSVLSGFFALIVLAYEGPLPAIAFSLGVLILFVGAIRALASRP